MKPPTALGTALCLLLLVGSACTEKMGEQVSLTSSSPDGAFRVELVEYTGRFDRNFYLRLQRVADRATTNIFDSPDEGRPVGTERIIWSRDSSRFLLLGKHFFVEAMAQLTNGEALYLLYDVRSGLLRCNATQRHGCTNIPPTELKGIEWTGSF